MINHHSPHKKNDFPFASFSSFSPSVSLRFQHEYQRFGMAKNLGSNASLPINSVIASLATQNRPEKFGTFKNCVPFAFRSSTSRFQQQPERPYVACSCDHLRTPSPSSCNSAPTARVRPNGPRPAEIGNRSSLGPLPRIPQRDIKKRWLV